MLATTEMKQLEPVLSQSIEQYEGILDFMRKMAEGIGTASADELLELNKSLEDLQSQATATDQVLLAQISKNSTLAETMQLLIDKRERILKEILLLNEGMTEKASGVKSLIAHEMAKLRTGISALSGYKQQQNHQGRIVDRTS